VFNPWVGQYEKHLEEISQLCAGQSGGRIKVFNYVFEHLNEPEETISTLTEKASRVFDDYVQEKILKAGLATGTLSTLETLTNLDLKLYINSGTASPALQDIIKKLGIHHFFSGVFGSTKEPIGGGKVENLQYIAEQEKLGPEAIIFVGDSDSDYKAAVEFRCDFIGISNEWNGWRKDAKSFPVISKLSDIPRLIN